ncbi:MAG: tail fiber domain-containing protein, partial [Flavobacteriales bacterium]|nr:tail fiber domain-containing protein [Flavobacteriales bacterium]
INSIGGFANWTNVSDARFKVNVKENINGLDFILKLRPVSYNLDMDAIANWYNTPDSLRLPEAEQLKAAETQTGFIAQEVEKAAQELGFEFHGVDAPKNKESHYGLRYAEFVVPLVKATQEQQTAIELLKEQNELLKKELAEIKALLKK